MNIWATVQNIDRRILYVITAAVLAVPLLARPSTHPPVVFPEVRHAYQTLRNVPPGKIVIISSTWGPGTRAENEPQFNALVRHSFIAGKKFVIVSWDPIGSELTYDDASAIAKQFHKTYGDDWVHLGYNPGPIYSVVSGMGKDFKGTFKRDKNGTDLNGIPMLKNVVDHNQIGAVAEITPSSTAASWIAYFNMPYSVPLIYCPTAVMAAEAYPFLDAGQFSGMLNGVIGAAQYETLVGEGHDRTYAAAASWALSAAHIYIILLVVVGNVGYVLGRRAAAAEGGRRGG